MKERIFNALIIASALVVVFVVVSNLAGNADPQALADQRALNHNRAVRTEQFEENIQPFVTVNGAFLAVVPALAVLGLAVGLVAVLRGYFSTVKPDALGLYPADRRQLIDLAPRAALAYHEAQQLAAMNSQPTTPATLTTTYAPAFHYRNNQEGMLSAGVPTGVCAAPAFAQLLATGQLGPGLPLLLGFSEAGALTGSWRDLYSSAIAGISGSGKTTTLRFLAAQSALHGARFCLIDPHSDAGADSLANTLSALQSTFLRDPATNDKAILATVKYAQSRLQGRIQGKDSDHSPIIVACDEFTSLMRSTALQEPLGGLIEDIAQQGRKVGCFALLSGQIWTADRAGGSSLRDSLASAYVHRLKRRQAGFLLGIGDRLPDTSDLPAGQAYLLRTSGEVMRVSIPLTTEADVLAVGQQLGKPTSAHFGHASRPLRALETEAAPAELGSGSEAATFSEQEAAILELIRAGKSQREIVLQVFGTSGGDSYQRAAREVGDVLRRFVQQHSQERTA